MELNIHSEHRLRSENLSYDIDVWYPILENFTFKTIFFPLKSNERDAIIRFNEISWKDKRDDNKLNFSDISVLKNLENDIDVNIKKHFPYGAFIRLCGRSPKDGEPLNTNLIYEMYRNKLSGLIDSGLPDILSTKMTAIARTPIMKVTNGSEAISLLLTSERVFSDMIDWKHYGEPEQICLREYKDEITLDYEFRVFVYNGKLTCISQYDHHSFYPHLLNIKDKVLDLIKKKILEINDCIGLKNYVADFAFFVEEYVILIEISPFFPCTGSSLFSWSSDLEILKGCNLPDVEFRIKLEKDVHPQLNDIVEINWDNRFETNHPAFYEFYKNYEINQLDIPYINKHFLFVYGTLKKGFHWNNKFLNERVGGKYISKAITKEKYILIIGECGVPYLLSGSNKEGKFVKGELWEINDESLKGLDEYEGISKEYYKRETINIKDENNNIIEAFVYTLNENFDNIQTDIIDEYSIEMHKKLYNPINHIQIKQLKYFKRPSDWGKLKQNFDLEIFNLCN